MDAKTRDVLFMLAVGLAAGFLASIIVGGSGLIRYLVSGIIGSFIGGPILNALGINLGLKNEIASRLVTSTFGAIIVVLLARILA